MGPSTYEIFTQLNNSLIRNKISMLKPKPAYIKENYNDKEYIYMFNYYEISKIPKECVFGFITRKDDPKQIVIRWEVISGKEHCKAQREYTCCF